MNNSNSSSQQSSLSDLSLEAKDSPTPDTVFSNFFGLYKQVCKEHLTSEQKLNGAKRQWAEMSEEQRNQFAPEKSNASLSVKSVSDAQLVEGIAPPARPISDTAFHNFMETFTIGLSQKAARRWETMSKSEREAYAPKDDVGGSPSGCLKSENGQETKPPQLVKEMFFTTPGQESCPKKRVRRCPKPVKKCRKPRCKPKCSRPKPRCCRPKPRCYKPKPRCRRPKPPCMR